MFCGYDPRPEYAIEDTMRLFYLDKGPGKPPRPIVAPGKGERKRLRKLLPILADAERRAARNTGTETAAHGFVTGRSPVTNAVAHIGYPVTVSADLSGWFDSVTPAQIAHGLTLAGLDSAQANDLARQVCTDLGADRQRPAQGLLTSPSACNLSAVALDRRILDRLREIDAGAVYTRYADDLTVSLTSADPAHVRAALDILRECAEGMHWKLATGKTRTQYASAGRRIVCGLSVGETDLRATRETRRKLRAAEHTTPPMPPSCRSGGRHARAIDRGIVRRNRSRSANGLREWSACKLPRACRPARIVVGANNRGRGIPTLASTGTERPAAQESTTRTATSTVARRRIIRTD